MARQRRPRSLKQPRFPWCARRSSPAYAVGNMGLSAQQPWRNVAYRQRRGKPYTWLCLRYALSGIVIAREARIGQGCAMTEADRQIAMPAPVPQFASPSSCPRDAPVALRVPLITTDPKLAQWNIPASLPCSHLRVDIAISNHGVCR